MNNQGSKKGSKKDSKNTKSNQQQHMLLDEEDEAISRAIEKAERDVVEGEAKMESAFEDFFKVLELKEEIRQSVETIQDLMKEVEQRKKCTLVDQQNQYKTLHHMSIFITTEMKDFQTKMQKIEVKSAALAAGKDLLKVHQTKEDSIIKELTTMKTLLSEKNQKIENEVLALKLQLANGPKIPQDIEEKIQTKKTSIEKLKKDLADTKAKVAAAKVQVKEKEAQAKAQEAENAQKMVKMQEYQKKIDDLYEERSHIYGTIFNEVQHIAELREKHTKLQEKVDVKQREIIATKDHLMEESKQLHISIKSKEGEIAKLTEDIEKAEKRNDEMKTILEGGALMKIKKQIEDLEGYVSKVQEDNINMEASFLQADLDEPTVYSDTSSHDNILQWMRNIETPNTEQENEDPLEDCEVSSTYQCEDTSVFKHPSDY